MHRGRAGGRGRPLARATVLVVALLLAVGVLRASGPGAAVAQGPPGTGGASASRADARSSPSPGASGVGGEAVSAAAEPTAGGSASASVAPLSPAEQRRADELRDAARAALERDGDGGGLGDLDTGSVGGVLWRLALVVVLIVVAVVVLQLLRRGPRARRRAAPGTAAPDGGAADLEREALRAEEAGEHRAAVVLWFRAGTSGLFERRRIRTARVGTAGQVARAAGDARVAALAVAHDRAAYGPGPVGPDASRGAREGWAAVLREAPADDAREDRP